MGNSTSNGFDQTQYLIGNEDSSSGDWPSDVDITLSTTASLSAGGDDVGVDGGEGEGHDADEEEEDGMLGGYEVEEDDMLGGESALADTTIVMNTTGDGPLEGGFIDTNKDSYDAMNDALELGGGYDEELHKRGVVVPVSRNLVPPAIAREFKLPILSYKVKEEYDSKWSDGSTGCLTTDDEADGYVYPVVEYRNKNKLKGGKMTAYDEMYNSDYSGGSGTEIWTTDEEMYA